MAQTGRQHRRLRAERVPANIRHAERVLDAAVAVVKVEVQYRTGPTARGAEAAKRELAEAVVEYLAAHWDGYVPENGSEAVRRMSDVRRSVVDARNVGLDLSTGRRIAPRG
jgi:hypothetical protein